MADRGSVVATVGGWQVFKWVGPRVDSGEMKPFSLKANGLWDHHWFDTFEEAEAAAKAAPPVRTISVRFRATLPPGLDVTDDQIQEWLDFELRASGSLAGGNPLAHHGLEAHDVIID